MHQSIWSFNISSPLTPPPPSPSKQPMGIWASSMPERRGIWNLAGWGGEFEPKVSSISSGMQVLYLYRGM